MAWGQRVVTSVNTEKYYQLKCQATDAAHENGANVWFADLGTAFAGKSATPTFFKFVEAATEGKYYIYSVASGKYVNVNNTALVQGETATTEWTVGTINDAGYVYISSSDKNYLNNAGGDNNIQIKNHSSGVSTGNPCSLWTLTEYDVTIESEGSTTATWATTSWSVIDDIPEAIKTIESTQYATAESNIQATSREVTVPAGYLISEIFYSGGGKRLDILGVDLLNSEGEVIATDYRFGYSGSARLNNAHRFKVETAGTYTIRYWVTFCTEANVSHGTITLKHKNVLGVSDKSEFSNTKVYTVTPADHATTGVWDVMSGSSRLSITAFSGNAVDPTSANQQFAFLTANGEYFLYSYGAEKFVVNNGGQLLTDELSENCLVTFLPSTIASDQQIYPIVVLVGGSQLHSSYQNHLSDQGGIITTWQHTESGGNALSIIPVADVDLSEVVAKIETYQITREKAKLSTLINEANTHTGKTYLGEVTLTALNNAITAAQTVVDNGSATYAQVTEQIANLTAVINDAPYINTVEEFSNNAIYTFVAKRNETSYMMYDSETPDYVASKYMKTTLEAGNDNVNCQWAVYKSSRGYYYLYNLGAQKFMGTQSAANTSIPFSATPQTTSLTFKVSDVSTHPIMFSTDGGNGAANHTFESFGGNNKAGLINWAGGFSDTTDNGNVHKVTIVGAIDDETLATITKKVEQYENVEEIKDFVATVQANQNVVGQYTAASLAPLTEAIEQYKTEGTDESYNAVVEQYNSVRENGEKVTLEPGEKFTIKCYDTNRGYMVYSTVEEKGSEEKPYLAGASSVYTKLPAIDAEGVYKEWAVLSLGGQNYIYNVQNKKFITSNNEVLFSETPSAFEFVAIDNLLWEVKGDNGRYLSFSPGWSEGGAAVVRTETSIDDGCKFYIEKTGETVAEEVENEVGNGVVSAWKEDLLVSLGYVGGYPLSKQEEIEAVSTLSEATAFEDANEKIQLTAGYYFLKGTGVGNDATWYVTYGDNGTDFVAKALADGEKLSAKHVWSLDEISGEEGYKLRSTNLAKYAQTAEAPATSQIVSDHQNGYKYTFTDNGQAKFTIKDGNGNVLRTESSGVLNQWSGETNETWYIIPAVELDVTLGADYGTIHLPFDVTLPDGLKAYAVTAVSDSYATLTVKEDIPANEGAILQGEGTHTLTIATASSDWNENQLLGSNVNTYVEGPAYVLGIVDSEIGLYKAALNKDGVGATGDTHFLNNANKAYLPAPAGQSLVKAFYFNFGGESTGIETLVPATDVNAPIYDLSGRRVLSTVKGGVYIQNGKKFIVK